MTERQAQPRRIMNDNLDPKPTEPRGPELAAAPCSAVLNAFEDAREALQTAREIMDGTYETEDIRRCRDDLYECETHLRPPNVKLCHPERVI